MPGIKGLTVAGEVRSVRAFDSKRGPRIGVTILVDRPLYRGTVEVAVPDGEVDERVGELEVGAEAVVDVEAMANNGDPWLIGHTCTVTAPSQRKDAAPRLPRNGRGNLGEALEAAGVQRSA